MKRKPILGLLCVVILIVASNQDLKAQKYEGNKEYLEFAEASANWTYEHMDSLINLWKSGFDPNSIFGYRPPSRLLETATIYAHLFEIKKKKVYAERAREILLAYDGHKKIYPQWAIEKRPDYTGGVPALPDFFTTQRFLRPYEILNKAGKFSELEQVELEKVIGQSINYLLQSQEWGAMNRAALRAETLAWAIRAVPDHKDIQTWKMYEKALISDNWGAWEIEDASHYNAIWLYALIGYGSAKESMQELFMEPEMYYYAQYFKELFCPDGMIPDFGDAYWQSNWSRWLVYFETCANIYQSNEHKWLADQIATKFIDYEKVQGIGLAYILLDCYLFGDQGVVPEIPNSGSMEVMEDVQGKKIVYRSGWNPNDTYCLLNYKDEGEAGYLSRHFLRDGIVVEEEKMTHGHSDENSIVLLMSGGNVLLHDGGYRDFMPSGLYGAYRQDYFHNRVCVRPGKMFFGQTEGESRYDVPDKHAVEGQNIIDYLRNSGAYKPVKTQKIDFLTFDDFDYSRTRVIDDHLGYQADRIFTWLKELECFVVIDIVKGTQESFFTAANLWHTRQVYDQGDGWFLTGYDTLRNKALDQNQKLLICFPDNHYKFTSVTKEGRYWQEEYAIAQYTAQNLEPGQIMTFVTVLKPISDGEEPEDFNAKVELVEMGNFENGLAVKISDDVRSWTIGAKKDLRKEMFRDYRRPKYTYESGKVKYGLLESNCDFFVFSDAEEYTLINVSKAIYNGKIIFEQKPNYFGLAFDGKGDVTGISKARYWREE